MQMQIVQQLHIIIIILHSIQYDIMCGEIFQTKILIVSFEITFSKDSSHAKLFACSCFQLCMQAKITKPFLSVNGDVCHLVN